MYLIYALYSISLLGDDKGFYYGCYKDVMKDRDLDGGMVEFFDNTPDKCIEHCLRCGKL